VLQTQGILVDEDFLFYALVLSCLLYAWLLDFAHLVSAFDLPLSKNNPRWTNVIENPLNFQHIDRHALQDIEQSSREIY